MTDSETHIKKSADQSGWIDLSGLQTTNFGPNWNKKSPETTKPKARKKDRIPFEKKEEEAHFEPTVAVAFHPEEASFQALVKILRKNALTYELFDIARLFLIKPERFIITIQSNTPDAPIYCTVPCNLPFDTEREAINYVLKHYLETFFRTEEKVVPPPKGTFQLVSRCGITGELLGPPNYHRYNELLQAHYTTLASKISFEKFISKIETVRDPEAVNAWLQKVTKSTRYFPHKRQKGEPEYYDGLEAASHFLLSKYKTQVLKKTTSLKIPGKHLSTLPPGPIRRSIEYTLKQQLHFPLETASHLRNRLLRLHFNLYRKEGKGVICAVKRKFRTCDTVFSPSIQNLFNFIEKNPCIRISSLTHDYLSTKKNSPDEEKTQIMIDLHWLVSEGYVTKYADGSLFVPPPIVPPKQQK